MTTEANMSRVSRIKRMGLVLGKSVQALLGFALLLGLVVGLGQLGVEWLTGGDFQGLFSFSEAVILPLWQAVCLLVLVGVLLFSILHIENQMFGIKTELMSIDSTLQELLPLVEEGREMQRFNAERELDEHMSQEVVTKEPPSSRSPSR